jgi:hypothetical protein
MINTRELRRGNVVAVTDNVGYGETHRKETRFLTVSSIGQFSVQYKEFRCVGCKPKPCEGIELNREWLLKFGFVEKDNWFYKEMFVLGFLTHDDNFQCEFKFAGAEGNWKLLEIKYVHQLQNLFFALTGTELTPIEA